MQAFITHTKEIVTGERLTNAIKEVMADMVRLAYAIRKEDAYASHVTEERKQQQLEKSLMYANSLIFADQITNFTVWQRINTKLTGECIALLP